MGAVGVLDDVRPADTFAEAPEVVRPGNRYPAALNRVVRHAETTAKTMNRLQALAERSRDDAIEKATANPTATTLAALAQAHAVLDEEDAATAAASAALALCTENAESPSVQFSARIALEVLQRFRHVEEADAAARNLPPVKSLALIRAAIAGDRGRFDEAFAAIEGEHGGLYDSFRGYLLGIQGRYAESIPFLRSALRDVPNDPEAAFNLSVGLWHMGAIRKAVAAALRASRSAPGRQDMSVHYMELLLVSERFDAVEVEIRRLLNENIVEDSRLMVIQARLQIAKGDMSKALSMLGKAQVLAQQENDKIQQGLIAANLLALRFDNKKISFTEFGTKAEQLLTHFPDNEIVVLTFARSRNRHSQADELREAVARVQDHTSPSRRAFLHHQVAFLDGDNDGAAAAAQEWFDTDKADPAAAGTAMTALGIGSERWEEAERIADYALGHYALGSALANNIAYTYAMSGRPLDGLKVLTPFEKDGGYVIQATLGLCHLASGDIATGMRMYRAAAKLAEADGPEWCALMATYQAVVTRQLGLERHTSPVALEAQSLAPRVLPDDWEDRPDFLRLHRVCVRNGWDWPPHL